MWGLSVGARVPARRGSFIGEVLANERLCREHYRLRLGLEAFGPSQPGQFVQVQCRAPGDPPADREVPWPDDRPPAIRQPELLAAVPLLRRPMSLAGRRPTHDGDQVDLIYRTVGAGTRWLATLKRRDALSVLGPLGNAFPISPSKPRAALIGGGVGVPPMIYLAEALTASGRHAVAFSGARSADLLPLTVEAGHPPHAQAEPRPCVAEFAAHGAASVVATDDGSLGFSGLVSDAFASWLDRGGCEPADLVAYACGPEAMMRAVAEACVARDIECHLAMERHMACGVGTCQSCVCKVRADNDRGWQYKLCCTDGPVFDARQIVW